MLIHKGTKQTCMYQLQSCSLRALLIHKGTKLDELGKVDINGLRALLIHKGTKRYCHIRYLLVLFESFVNS